MMALQETDGGPGTFAVEGVANAPGAVGIVGFSKVFEAVRAHTESPDPIGALVARSLNVQSEGTALFAEKVGDKGLAGHFIGSVHITRNLSVAGDITLPNADIAEEFPIADDADVEPGTVMVLTDDEALRPSDHPYDRRVVGIVSGAGTFRPGLVLDSRRHPSRLPIALLGKVFCKVDAEFGPVAVGDLLATSPTPGHAMRATDPARAFGAVVGKALSKLDSGRGLVPVFATLQ
ncbi:MAG: hypothetical protein ACRDRH_18395 [Pseudonocardia sp.]